MQSAALKSAFALGIPLALAGCSYDPASTKAPKAEQAAAPAQATPAAPPVATPAAPPSPPATPPAAPTAPPAGRTILEQRTREILDMKVAQADPNFVLSNEAAASGGDPLTVVGGTGVRIASVAGALPLKDWINKQKQVEGKYPTYAELMRWMKENPGYELPARRPYHKYAYDADTGAFKILEDKALKARMFAEAGISQ